MKCKRTYLRLKYRKNPLKYGFLGAVSLFAIILFSVVAVAQLVPSQTEVKQSYSNTYTKWYFTRAECRYIFPEGSCVVDDNYCDKGSYDYQVIELEPHTDYCHAGTIVYNTRGENTQPRIVESNTDGECAFEVAEGDAVRLAPEGYDPDPEIGPAGRLIWTFYQPFDTSGVWRTQKGDAGRTWSKVRLSDGELYDEQEFCVDVISVNGPPVLSGLRDISVKEGSVVKIEPRCTDPDGDRVTITISGWMTSGEKTVGYDEQGRHTVTITCTDTYDNVDTQDISVTVQDENRPPVLNVPSSLSVNEGELARIRATASDPDGDDVTITYGAPFAADGTWRTRTGDAGQREVTVTASDGERQVTKTVVVTVNRVNSKPTISGLRDIQVYEGDVIVLRPNVRDPDNDQVTVKYSGWMTSDTKQTGYDDAGEYDVTITVSDGTEEASESIHITVLNRNRPPVITALK